MYCAPHVLPYYMVKSSVYRGAQYMYYAQHIHPYYIVKSWVCRGLHCMQCLLHVPFYDRVKVGVHIICFMHHMSPILYSEIIGMQGSTLYISCTTCSPILYSEIIGTYYYASHVLPYYIVKSWVCRGPHCIYHASQVPPYYIVKSCVCRCLHCTNAHYMFSDIM